MTSRHHVTVIVRPGGAAVVTLLALASAISVARGEGDPAKGNAAFVRQCALCHTIARGAPNSYGPNLFGIVGHRAASVAGYKYSRAFAASAQWNWSPDVLGAWISDPAAMIPGSTMDVFQGVADSDRDDIVAYLANQR